MRLVWRRGFVLVLVTLLAAACGGGSTSSTSNEKAKESPSPSPSPVRYAVSDVCTLVTLDDAKAQLKDQQIVNLTAQAGVSIPGFCFYGDNAANKNLSVFIYAVASADAASADQVQPEQLAAAMGGRVGINNAHPVSGIGDKAVEYTTTSSSGNGLAIFAFKSNVVIMVAVQPTNDPNAVEGLAKTAIGNLKTAA